MQADPRQSSDASHEASSGLPWDKLPQLVPDGPTFYHKQDVQPALQTPTERSHPASVVEQEAWD